MIYLRLLFAVLGGIVTCAVREWASDADYTSWEQSTLSMVYAIALLILLNESDRISNRKEPK